MSTTKPPINPSESEPSANDRLSRIRTTMLQATALIRNEHILKLDGSNFKSWENRISIILDDFIDDPDFLHREGPTLSSDEKICRGILIYSLPEAIHLRPCKAIYDHLRRLYHVITQAGQLSGLEGLLNSRMQPDEAPSLYAVRLRSSANKFTQWGGNFSKDLLLGLLLQRGIQDQEMARTVMSQLENEIGNKNRNPSFATCHQILESAYQQHHCNTTPAKQDEPTVFNQASIIKQPAQDNTYDVDSIDLATLKAAIRGTCHHCKKAGHFARDCRSKRASNISIPPFNSNSQFRAYYPIITPPTWPAGRSLAQPGPAQTKPADYYRPQYPNKPATPVNVRFAELGDDEDLMNLFQAEVDGDDNVGGRESQQRQGTGTTGGKMYTQGNNLLFCNTTNVPLLTAKFNTQRRCWFFLPHLNANELRECMRDTRDKIVSLKTRVDDRHEGVLAKDESLLWHKLFGHCGMRRLRNFLKERIGDDIGKHLNNPVDNCADCLIAKSKRRSELLPTNRMTGPMDIVASDIMGPFNQANINSGRWALTIRDVSSTYGECHIITTKADAAAVLQGVIARWEVKCDRKLKVLQTDGGGEFWSKGMVHWCSMKGITHEQSLPMYHEQNGVAERYNRSVADMGRTILRSSSLGNAFWGYAFMWAAYTINNIPNERTGRLKPAEILFNETPPLDKMRIFGEKAYVHITREHRWKLDDRAHEGHVVMYLQQAKGWLFYIPGANKMIPSAWATFPGSSRLTTMLRKGQQFEPQEKEANNKMGIPFLLNNLQLGDFSREKKFAEQEQMAAKIAKPSDVIPRTYKEAMRSHESEEWSRAIEEELQNMKRMDMFEVAPLDKMQHTINGGWIFTKKIDNLLGQVRYKARYVARGNKQCYDKEYRETFAPTATFSTLRLLLTWAAKHNWLVHSFDFTAAYLNAPMDMEVWIKLPDGMNVPPNMGCQLKKALYGTRQAGRCWWEHLGGRLKALGFSKSAFDNSVYFNFRNNAMTWIHVDDGVVIAQTKKDLDDLKQGLERSFLIKWKEGVENMIGMEIERQVAGFTLTQKRLIKSIISKHWDRKRANATPLPAKSEFCSESASPTRTSTWTPTLGNAVALTGIPSSNSKARIEVIPERQGDRGIFGRELGRGILAIHPWILTNGTWLRNCLELEEASDGGSINKSCGIHGSKLSVQARYVDEATNQGCVWEKHASIITM
ncbi:hypothetical protein O181_067384 [Austropuccinia psidii MF-1]|uniref:Integrase catalytic domain-containing protein n=1 Tax=Austropuccinia psidii MF-1 TaxID=1389203 RepID=A0A9Q3EUU0_9BASI|nr:hypothetical protein [Austropuccinia psidii MF-1]